MYADGKGTEQDYIHAYAWLALATAKGNRSASSKVQSFIHNMTNTQQQEAKTLVSELSLRAGVRTK